MRQQPHEGTSASKECQSEAEPEKRSLRTVLLNFYLVFLDNSLTEAVKRLPLDNPIVTPKLNLCSAINDRTDIFYGRNVSCRFSAYHLVIGIN